MKHGLFIVKRICFIILFAMVDIGFSQERVVYTFFINLVSEEFNIPLIVFVNVATGNHSAPQIGFVNQNTGNFSGSQIGFVNTSGADTRGSQIGFVNTSGGDAKSLQIGFVNYADSIESGVPIGFISIVKRGGLKAVEYSFSEFYPFNIELKTGVKKFYTNIIVAYDTFGKIASKQVAMGMGIGSIIRYTIACFLIPN